MMMIVFDEKKLDVQWFDVFEMMIYAKKKIKFDIQMKLDKYITV